MYRTQVKMLSLWKTILSHFDLAILYKALYPLREAPSVLSMVPTTHYATSLLRRFATGCLKSSYSLAFEAHSRGRRRCDSNSVFEWVSRFDRFCVFLCALKIVSTIPKKILKILPNLAGFRLDRFDKSLYNWKLSFYTLICPRRRQFLGVGGNKYLVFRGNATKIFSIASQILAKEKTKNFGVRKKFFKLTTKIGGTQSPTT